MNFQGTVSQIRQHQSITFGQALVRTSPIENAIFFSQKQAKSLYKFISQEARRFNLRIDLQTIVLVSLYTLILHIFDATDLEIHIKMKSHRSNILASMLKSRNSKSYKTSDPDTNTQKIDFIRTDFCIMIHDSQPITDIKIRVFENSAATPLYLYMYLYLLIVYI